MTVHEDGEFSGTVLALCKIPRDISRRGNNAIAR